MYQFTEDNLIKALQDPKTQRKAFEEMVKRYSPQLYSQIRRMVLSHDDTDDILQNTFLKAWSNLSSFRGEAKVSTWLYRIAFNETLAFLGKQRNDIPIDDPEASVVNYLMSDDYFDEMKYEAISEILGTTVGGLKASYHLAVEKIEKFLNGDY